MPPKAASFDLKEECQHLKLRSKALWALTDVSCSALADVALATRLIGFLICALKYETSPKNNRISFIVVLINVAPSGLQRVCWIDAAAPILYGPMAPLFIC
jgi:hypothetical protein